MEKRIEKMKNHYIVCGIGMVGLYIVKELYQTRRHVVAIDMHEGVLETMKAQSINVDMLLGDATEKRDSRQGDDPQSQRAFCHHQFGQRQYCNSPHGEAAKPWTEGDLAVQRYEEHR